MAYVPPQCAERFVASCEKIFNLAAAIPLVATITSIARFIFGLIQAVVGLLAMPFASCCAKNGFRRSASHVVNGLANCGIALLEAIPGVGTCIYFKRPGVAICSEEPKRPNSGQETLIVGYKVLHDAVYKAKPDELSAQKELVLGRGASRISLQVSNEGTFKSYNPRWVF